MFMVRSYTKEATVPRQHIQIHEGKPQGLPTNGERWIRLLVRQNPRAEDKEAEELLHHFAEALADSEFEDEFVLSIFRIGASEEPSFGILPKIENARGFDGIKQVRRYLSMYTEDIKVPLAI
jgi:hypothetical protein